MQSMVIKDLMVRKNMRSIEIAVDMGISLSSLYKFSQGKPGLSRAILFVINRYIADNAPDEKTRKKTRTNN